MKKVSLKNRRFGNEISQQETGFLRASRVSANSVTIDRGSDRPYHQRSLPLSIFLLLKNC
ncbi:hypothetical protein [Microseira wollei]|uniref:hypothetical protein n=1 Tax=Microseira wollei TaxID=467598 RepID=UPI001CFDB784|nr:hypothetical protein [Microseira wollei]